MKNKSILHLLTLICLYASPTFSQTKSDTILLWPKGAPGALGNAAEDKPCITLFKPEGKPTGSAIVIFPGGGYVALAKDHEGIQVAKYFTKLGITAIVVQYRLGTRDHNKYQHPAMFNDATRAIRMVRSKATEWNLDVNKIGIMGFSAGGHLASTLGTHFDHGNPKATDPVERMSSRPSFMILVYPVISLTTEYTHRFSREVLIGKDLPEDLAKELSNEQKVSPFTPPTILIHSTDDSAVPPENSILFYLALRKAGVPAEIHVYEKGNHGYGMTSKDPILATWIDRVRDWMSWQGLFSSK